MKSGGDERLMTRYLLGRLDEAEVLEVETALFADDDAYERLLALEDELVEAYAAGRLEGDERAAFETRYLATERGLRRVATTRALDRLAGADAGVPRAGAVAIADARQRRASRLVVPLALAASLALAAGAVYWLATRDAGRGGPVVRTDEPPQPGPGPGVPTVPVPPPDADNTNAAGGQMSPPHRRVVSVTLETPEFRGDATERAVTMPEDAESLHLTLAFEGEGYRSYRAVVTGPGGRSVWSRDGLAATASAQQRLAVSVPADRLSPGRYMITVSGRTAAGEYEDVADYAVRVAREPLKK